MDQPSSSGSKPKKVEFSGGTKKASALKNAHEAMTVGIFEVEVEEVADVASHEWLADIGASRHICNDLRMLWDVTQLPEPIIVRQHGWGLGVGRNPGCGLRTMLIVIFAI